jgi:hypothetical protein
MTHQSGGGGYRNPPRATQFGPGKSGNPKGRGRNRPSSSKLLHKILFEPVRFKTEGGARTLPALTIMLLAARAKALNGDHRAQRNFATLTDLLGLVGPIQPPIPGRKYGIVVAPELFRDPWDKVDEEAVPAAPGDGHDESGAVGNPGSGTDADKER